MRRRGEKGKRGKGEKGPSTAVHPLRKATVQLAKQMNYLSKVTVHAVLLLGEGKMNY
jgi:hypothetical protein